MSPASQPPASQPPAPRPRPRALGLRMGLLQPGPTNSIVDVADVAVGHATVWRDEPAPPVGRGVARTGVTAIVPFRADELFDARHSRTRHSRNQWHADRKSVV